MLILSIVFLAVALGLCAILYRVLCRDAALTEDKENLLLFMLTLIWFFSLFGGAVGNKYFADKSTTEAQKESEQNEKRLHERNQYLRKQLELGFEQRENYKQILSDSLDILKMKNEIKTLNEGK